MQKVTSKDGTIISYLKEGYGPPLLLVHGTTADHSRWLPLIPDFKKHFTVYAMDRRGRGASGDSPEYNLYKEAEDIAAVVNDIGQPVSVLGHSYGALCTLESILLTNNISGVVLYEPLIPVDKIYPEGIMDKMQELIDSDKKEAALELFFREVVNMPEEELKNYRKLPAWNVRIQLVPTIQRETLAEEGYHFLPERFEGMNIPVLLLLGGESSRLFRISTETINAALPGSRIVVLPGQRHIAMDTNKELFLSEVLDFLTVINRRNLQYDQ